MKIQKIIILLALLSILSCQKGTKSIVAEKKITPATEQPLRKAKDTVKTIYEPSTFCDPGLDDRFNVRTGLAELDKAGVFDSVHRIQITKLSDIHFGALKSLGKNFKLLYIADGSLFAPGNKDKAIVAYQPDKRYLTILLYNDSNGDMGELYGDYKVANGLKDVKCHYSAFGTLDYQLASEIVYQKEHLLKEPKSFLENIPCIIGDFSKNEDYAPEGGCFSPKALKLTGNVLSISTSFVYNNWECLKYDKKTDSFLICYGQAFAD